MRTGQRRTIYFPDDIWEELKKKRKAVGIPVSTSVSRAVRRYLRG